MENEKKKHMHVLLLTPPVPHSKLKLGYIIADTDLDRLHKKYGECLDTLEQTPYLLDLVNTHYFMNYKFDSTVKALQDYDPYFKQYNFVSFDEMVAQGKAWLDKNIDLMKEQGYLKLWKLKK